MTPGAAMRTRTTGGRASRVPTTPGGVHYSWCALLLGTLTKACSSPGQSPFIGVFISAYIADLALARTWVSSLYFVATMASACALPAAGAEMDRRGLRASAVIASGGLAATCAAFGALVRGPVSLLLGFFCLRFFGQGLMSLVGSNVINMWWRDARGRVQGVSGVGLTLVMTGALPPLAKLGLNAIGWRWFYGALSAALALGYLPVAALFILDSPEAHGLLPDGKFPAKSDFEDDDDHDDEQREALLLADAGYAPTHARTRSLARSLTHSPRSVDRGGGQRRR